MLGRHIRSYHQPGLVIYPLWHRDKFDRDEAKQQTKLLPRREQHLVFQHREPVVMQHIPSYDVGHCHSRAGVLRAVAAAGLAALALGPVSEASAADFQEFQQGFLSLPVSMPEPIMFPRKSLVLNFAVLLLRAAYEAADDLDFIAMVGALFCDVCFIPF
jgi:hypothetical protein